MIKSLMFLCAERIITDQDSNNLSIINLLEGIQTASFPLAMPQFACVAWVERDVKDPEEIELQFRIDLGENELFNNKFLVAFKGLLRARMVVNIGGIPIQAPGLLKFTLLHERKELDSYSLGIQLLKNAKPKIDVRTTTK